MKTYLSAAAAIAVVSALSAQAGTIDFTDPAFASTFPAFGDQSEATLEIDGVNFTFLPTARGTDGFRQAFDDTGLSFGLPGNGMNTLQVIADQDVTYTSLTAEDRTLLNNSTGALFNIQDNGVFVVQDLALPTTFAEVDFNDLSLSAGDVLTIQFSFEARQGFNVLFSSAVLGSLAFETDAGVDPIPLPAGLPLMLGGLGAFAWMRSKS